MLNFLTQYVLNPYVLLIFGFVILIKGSDVFISGSASVAKKFGIPDLVIGLTVVAMGTSAPELAVSMAAAARHNNSVAISNVMGSNIFNMLVILGLCAIIAPIALNKLILIKEFTILILASFGLLFLAADRFLGDPSGDILSRSDGLILVTAFSIYMYSILKYSARSMKKTKRSLARASKIKEEIEERNANIEHIVSKINPKDSLLYSLVVEAAKSKEAADEKGRLERAEKRRELIETITEEEPVVNSISHGEEVKELPMTLSWFFVVVGIIAVCFGGDMVVNNAKSIAESFNVSDTVIGLTVVGIGTSLPELVTSVVATKNGNPEMALGNVIGSNLFNVLLTLGLSATIIPMKVSDLAIQDALALSIFTGIIFLMVKKT